MTVQLPHLISIVVPCFNEARSLGELFLACGAGDFLELSREVSGTLDQNRTSAGARKVTRDGRVRNAMFGDQPSHAHDCNAV